MNFMEGSTERSSSTPSKKGLNFLQAVAAMQEGKRVYRKSQPDWICYKTDKGNYLIFSKKLGRDFRTFSAHMEWIEATDWEVVDEYADWNLADNYTKNDEWDPFYDEEVVKKCRELILKDIERMQDNTQRGVPDKVVGLDYAKDIVKKRFGDL